MMDEEAILPDVPVVLVKCEGNCGRKVFDKKEVGLTDCNLCVICHIRKVNSERANSFAT